ncbi:MAG: sugar-binding transcriptional regulator [Gammaproteobacteria bacterium]|nr:sugar-binding transcriptional regulator [Gammaproteobacteria bacterium]
MNPSDHERLLVKVARLYYEHELTQADISKQLRLSRQKVQRLLQTARREGVVQISIRPLMGIFDEEERQIEGAFGLREAIIVETTAYNDHDTVTQEIGVAAAEYLLRVLQPNDTITISWGSSLREMVNALNTNANKNEVGGVRVVQGLGGLGDPTTEVHAADLTRRLAHILNGQAVLLPAPGITGSLAAGEAFLTDPHVQQALQTARSANLAFMGIGAPRRDSILIRRGTIVAWGELKTFKEHGAVGDINLRYFDINGRLIKTALNNRVIGLTLDEIRQIETVVGIAGGEAKYQAIHGAIRGRLIDVLVTDDVTARRLLEDSNE